MNETGRRATLGLLLLAAAAPVAGQYGRLEDATDISVSGKTPESIILSWPTFSYRLARLMIAKYGQPTEARDRSLIWLDNGPWKRTVVYRDPPSGFLRKTGRLEQAVAYRVPSEKLEVLARFDKDLEASAEGRLTARSDSESENFLALNLADEVVQGKRTALEASAFRRTVEQLEGAGKSSSYLDGLMFKRADEFANPESPD